MKYLKYIFLVLFLVIILPGLIYLGLAIYYQDSFMYGTWINGIYCTGKTIEEAAQELEKQFDYNEILVKTPAGDEKLILSDIDADVDFITALETYRRRQNPYVWYTGIFKKTGERKVHPQVNYSSEKLKEWLFNIKSYKDTINVGNDILSIKLTEEGYRLKEEKTLILNPDAALEVLEKAIFSGKKEAVLSEELCFFYREETLDMKNLREKFAKVEAFQNLDFTYHIKETKRKLSACELAEFLQVDENKVPSLGKSGELLFDEKRVEDFIEKLAKESDTWNNHYFETHDGEVVHIKKGNYGTRISKEKEKAFLKKWLSAPENTVHTPVYLTDVTYKDKNKIEDTYVEIDLGLQKMFYFIDGKKVLETDVVTGCVSQKMATPELVCYIRAKSRNATLRGANYSSFVNYWMPVYGGIGIHDAGWRNEFGGEIYLKSGSHGCINTPLEKVTELYENIEVGVPVVIHK